MGKNIFKRNCLAKTITSTIIFSIPNAFTIQDAKCLPNTPKLIALCEKRWCQQPTEINASAHICKKKKYRQHQHNLLSCDRLSFFPLVFLIRVHSSIQLLLLLFFIYGVIRGAGDIALIQFSSHSFLHFTIRSNTDSSNVVTQSKHLTVGHTS